MRTAAAKLAGSARPRAGDVERGAVIGAGANERQAERHVDAVLDAEVLHRDQPVVVGHRDDDVELAGMPGGVARAHEHGVGRERAARVDAFGARRLHRRGDDAQLLVAEQAALAGVRIEPGDGDARLAPPRTGALRRAAIADRLEDRVEGDRLDRLAQRHVDRHQHGAQLVVGQHHAHRRRRARRGRPRAPAASRCGPDSRCRRRRTLPCGSAP